MAAPAHFSAARPFLRRRDLLALGENDLSIRAALDARLIFRVRHGWYAAVTTPDDAVRAIRVGGRLTGLSALASLGLMVPRPRRVTLAVPRNAARLRRPRDKARRLRADDGIRVIWTDEQRGRTDPSSWRVGAPEALAVVLRLEPREVAIACCDAVLKAGVMSAEQVDAAFASAPERCSGWRSLVDGRAGSHGETYFRLRCREAGIPFIPQPYVHGVGHLDGQIGRRTYVEIDGRQHDENWDGETPSSFENDHVRDTTMAILRKRVLRFTYRQIHLDFASCAGAMRVALDEERLLIAAEARRRSRKRRRSAMNHAAGSPRPALARDSP